MNQSQPTARSGQESNMVPEGSNHITLSKKDLKLKIGSRKDFVLLFGFESKVKSGVLSAAQAVYYLAFH